MKTYPSKVDLWLVIVLGISFGCPIVIGILDNNYYFSGIFIVISIITFFYLKKIQYTIHNEHLIICKTKINIKSIRKIYRTRNIISSPALSLDRIAIVYNHYDEVLISPINKEDFIEELMKINPNIIFNDQG
jgi:hypothetical protein